MGKSSPPERLSRPQDVNFESQLRKHYYDGQDLVVFIHNIGRQLQRLESLRRTAILLLDGAGTKRIRA